RARAQDVPAARGHPGRVPVVGLLGCRLGQTQVVSEMVAGVLLGPSLFGLFAPAAHQWLFPREGVSGLPHPSMSVVFAISQVGLVLYMFLSGSISRPRSSWGEPGARGRSSRAPASSFRSRSAAHSA